MKKRIIALTLALVFVIGAFSAFSLTAGAEETVPELSITGCNLSFRSSVCIKYAVRSNVSDVKLLVWTSPETEYTYGTQDDEIGEYYIDNEIGGAFVFDYTKLAAKQMTDVLYVRAYTCVDGVDYYSNVNKYSILQYAYNKLGKTATASTDTELKEMLTSMLAYGAAAQKYLDDYKVDRLATADWYQVKLTAGLLDDGCTHGLYLSGDKVTLTAPTSDGTGVPFSHWASSDGDKIATTATYELTVGNKNEVYTPVYANPVSSSAGLEYDSNGDGTCYVIGMGDCLDTELVIPAESPDGDTVIGIEASAFAGEAITSVSFPSTIEEIGRRAFNNCTALTDVYYDGTEEEWEEVSISTGNTAIENATMHFKEAPAVTFTVTFKDYDGTTLKTEAVESGKSATAPEAPERDGYTFTGWDKSFDNITGDLTVTAQYKYNTTEPAIVVSNVTASAGETVTVKLQIINNPGFLTMALKTTFASETLTLNQMSNGADFAYYTFTAPAKKVSGCTSAWFAAELPEEVIDGELMTLKFTVDENAAPGKYSVTITCPDDGSTVDGNKTAFSLAEAVGYIIVE